MEEIKELEQKQQDQENSKRKDKKGKKKDRKKHGPNPKRVAEFSSCNDFQWYNQNPQVTADAARVNFSNALGLSMSLEYSAGDGSPLPVRNVLNVPGIMTLHYIPTIGKSTDAQSNINVASRLVYTFIRHVNSGSRNYEAPDYMTYLLAVSSAHMYYAELVRLYGILNTTSVTNRYINRPLVMALGYDFENLQSNMASLRYYINQFAIKLNTFAVPKAMYLFDRNAFLPLHIFKDGDATKSQLYAFIPAGYYKWDGTGTTGSALRFRGNGEIKQLSDIVSFGNEMLSALLENEDIGVMSGDTLKAFGETGLRSVAQIPDQYSTAFIKDEGILAQIHNSYALDLMNVIEDNTHWNLFDVEQANGHLIFNPSVPNTIVSETGCAHSQFFDAISEIPSPEYIMEATRLKNYWFTKTEGSSTVYKVNTVGTEMLFGYRVYKISQNGGVTQSDFSSRTSNSGLINQLSKFDWHPYIYNTFNASDGHTIEVPYGDSQNLTVLDWETCDKINNAALQSLFNVYGLYIRNK